MSNQDKTTSRTAPTPLLFSDYLRNPEVSDEARKELAQPWILSFKAVHDQLTGTLYQDIHHAFEYLDTSCGLSVPAIKPGTTELRWLQRNAGNDNPSLYIAPLAQSDATFHPALAQRSHFVAYTEPDHTLSLPADTYSPRWQAILLYNGLLRGIDYTEGQYRREDSDSERTQAYWAEEYNLMLKTIRLVRKLYGVPYSTAAYRLSKRYERQLRDNKLTIHRSGEVRLQLLERVYGQAESESERYIQANMLELDALFHALDRVHPVSGKQDHSAMLKWFHGLNDRAVMDTEHNYLQVA